MFEDTTKERVREAAYVVAYEYQGTLVVRCDEDDRLDYYLKTEKTGGGTAYGPAPRRTSRRWRAK